MRFTVLNRKVHRWASIILAIPMLVMIASGILLQTKKHWSWVQPHEQRGTGTMPQIDLPQVLAAVSSLPDLGVRSWDDVNRVDVRPGRGVAKVWLHNGWEVQVDLGTGRVLQTAYRRSDLIESIPRRLLLRGQLDEAWPLPSGGARIPAPVAERGLDVLAARSPPGGGQRQPPSRRTVASP